MEFPRAAIAEVERLIRPHVRRTPVLHARGAMKIHAYDEPGAILGQGSVALEWEEQAPEVDTLLVAVGGGGLIGGIAAWYEGDVRIIAVEPDGAPTLFRALAAGRPVDA